MSVLRPPFTAGGKWLALLLTLSLAACGGSGGDGAGGSDTPTNDDPAGKPSADAPENRYAPHEASLHAWAHGNAEQNDQSAVADDQIRTSTRYAASVALASGEGDTQASHVYMTLPRSGREKWGYNHEDGAEFASQAGLTMSWTSFLYAEDAWLEIDLLDGQTLSSIDEVTLRPTTLDFERELVDEDTIRVRIPYSENGYRFSVEFDHDLMTSYNNNQGGTGTLSETPEGARIHTEPRNAMLVFAEPTLSESDQERYIPSEEDGDIFYPEPGEIDYLDTVSADIIYFKPGTYYFPWNYHADLSSRVRWVYLAPGAYVKGAFEFVDGPTQYKVTGYGVLSGEKYVYEADRDTSDGHEAYTHRSDSRDNCHSSCVKMLQFFSGDSSQSLDLQGITVVEPPYHSFVIYGNKSTFQSKAHNYKQVGAWYWQTDGIELFDGGQLTNSFFHANDDVFKLYHSNLLVRNVVVWKGENGPVFQWGWTPRHIENIQVDDVDIIHNRMYWKDQKHNTCLINSARAWWDSSANNTADPAQTIRDVSLNNIRSEGMNLCAMRFYAQSSWDNIQINGLFIDAWNDLAPASQESHLKALWNEAESEQVSIGAGAPGLLIHNYVVDRQPIEKNGDNWGAEALGRLNFDLELWEDWTATTDLAPTCTEQTIDFQPIGDVHLGETVELQATASSGLPVRLYALEGNAQLDGATLTMGEEPSFLVLVAAQDGDDVYCGARERQTFELVADPRWIGASWAGWSPSEVPMVWDTQLELYRAVADLDAGSHAMKFTDTEDWSGDDWGNATGLTGVASLTTGGGADITFDIDSAGEYLITFDADTLEYAVSATGTDGADPVPAPGDRWVGASWDGWSPGNLPMSWDGVDEFEVTVTLEAGDYELKFTDTDNWSGDDWGDATGLEGTVSLTTGGGPNVSFTIDAAGSYVIRFNPDSLAYSITPEA